MVCFRLMRSKYTLTESFKSLITQLSPFTRACDIFTVKITGAPILSVRTLGTSLLFRILTLTLSPFAAWYNFVSPGKLWSMCVLWKCTSILRKYIWIFLGISFSLWSQCYTHSDIISFLVVISQSSCCCCWMFVRTKLCAIKWGHIDSINAYSLTFFDQRLGTGASW